MRTGPTCGAPVACLRKDCTIWKTIEGRILTITNPMILLSILFIALAIAVSHWCAAEAGLSPHPQGTTSASTFVSENSVRLIISDMISMELSCAKMVHFLGITYMTFLTVTIKEPFGGISS